MFLQHRYALGITLNGIAIAAHLPPKMYTAKQTYPIAPPQPKADIMKDSKSTPPPPAPTPATSAECDLFPAQGISRLKKVCMMTGLSKSTIYAWVRAGKFPAPIKLSPSMTAWRNNDVLDWINSLEQADKPTFAPYHSTTIH